MDFRVSLIIEDIETSFGLLGITQAFALLHVLRLQVGNLFFSFERNGSTLKNERNSEVHYKLQYKKINLKFTLLVN